DQMILLFSITAHLSASARDGLFHRYCNPTFWFSIPEGPRGPSLRPTDGGLPTALRSHRRYRVLVRQVCSYLSPTFRVEQNSLLPNRCAVARECIPRNNIDPNSRD